jgi:glucose-6-phosphate 1-dehydrogenase
MILQSEANIPTVLVIFGITGDLSLGKLLPALYHLQKNGMLPDIFKVIGVARSEYSDRQFQDIVQEKMQHIKNMDFDEYTWKGFADSLIYLKGELTEKKTFEELAKRLNKIDDKYGICTHKVFYMAIYPELIEKVVEGIQHSLLFQICKNIRDTKVVVEKPFGESLSDFDDLNKKIGKAFSEKQIYRIDHFLGKETVQNIMYFRAANPIFFGNWNKKNIDMIEVSVHESIGIEKRGRYFDHYGQLRDMVQSHLMQLLAISLMDLPDKLDPDKIASAKADLIGRLKIKDFKQDVLRAQYKAGVVDGSMVKSYEDEEFVSKDSRTETFVRINAEIEGGNWDGLKVRLITGKRLQQKNTLIKINYKPGSVIEGVNSHNALMINIQPKEGIVLEMLVKRPGTDKLDKVDMVFNYKESFRTILPDAYEKILLDILRLKRGISISAAELEASWKFVDKIRNYWEKYKPEMAAYSAGSNEILDQ